MQEKNITAAGKKYSLGKPFFVLATQNPIEQEGTYPLPEAQLDRFMFNVWLDYPSFEEELNVVKNTTGNHKTELKKILNAEEITFFQDLIRRIPVPDNVMEFAVRLSTSTRPSDTKAPEITKQYLVWGAGPRASQYLVIGAKCHAAIKGKYAPDIEDVKAVAHSILRHRIVRNYKAEAEGISVETIIDALLK
jgi:MoxR-like ATPase